MADVVVAGYARTPIGKFRGQFTGVPAPRLGAAAIREALRRSSVEPKEVSEVFMGCVIQAGLYQNPARQATIYSGIPPSVSATTVNMVCGSGLRAVIEGFHYIQHEPDAVVAAGGMECMTNAPYLLPKGRMGYAMGHGEVLDSMITDGLWDIYNNYHMGNTGELIAERLGITRKDVDEFSLRSQQLAAKAAKSGHFGKEIVPVEVEGPKGKATATADEGIRETTMESLSKLKPVFRKDGVLTAGNSSQISDGASATILMSAATAKRRGIEPKGKLGKFCSFAVPPEEVMFAPIPCVRRLMDKTGLKINDFEMVEHNEAFSSASVGVRKELGIPLEAFNVHGGAVALGHPIGCSGNRILVTLLNGMERLNLHRGLATLCIGGGDSLAMVVER